MSFSYYSSFISLSWNCEASTPRSMSELPASIFGRDSGKKVERGGRKMPLVPYHGRETVYAIYGEMWGEIGIDWWKTDAGSAGKTATREFRSILDPTYVLRPIANWDLWCPSSTGQKVSCSSDSKSISSSASCSLWMTCSSRWRRKIVIRSKSAIHAWAVSYRFLAVIHFISLRGPLGRCLNRGMVTRGKGRTALHAHSHKWLW